MAKRLFGGTVHTALVHAATRFDMAEAARAAKRPHGYHNPYALGHYLGRIEAVEADIARGATVRAALCAGFSGALLNALLRAVGEAPFSESKHWPRYLYVPVTARP